MNREGCGFYHLICFSKLPSLFTQMKRTGEQVIGTRKEIEQVFGDIIFRYELAKQFCKGKKVLDIGCGTGAGTFHLKEVAEHITGFDHSGEALEYADKNNAGFNIDYKEGNAEKPFPFHEKQFDIITAFEFIEHIHNYEGFIKECLRVLKPEGMLIITTPNAEVNKEMHEHHIKEFNQEEMRELLKSFKEVIIKGINYSEDFTNRLEKSEKTSGLVAHTPSFIKNLVPGFIRIWIAKILGFNATKNDFNVTDNAATANKLYVRAVK